MAVRKPVKNICLRIPLLRRIVIKQQGNLRESESENATSAKPILPN